MTRTIGFKKEKQALAFLKKQGLKLITKNFSAKCGEIDLIMRDNDTIVFVEVRYRHNNNFGDGIDSVNYQKQQKILNTAKIYLAKHNLNGKAPCRIDIVAISDNEPPITWLKNAVDSW